MIDEVGRITVGAAESAFTRHRVPDGVQPFDKGYPSNEQVYYSSNKKSCYNSHINNKALTILSKPLSND